MLPTELARLVFVFQKCGVRRAIDGTHTSSDFVLKNGQTNKYAFNFGKRQFEIILIDLNSIVIENAFHLSKSPIKMF